MESAFRIQQALSSGACARKFDRRLDTFAARTAEKCLRHFSAGPGAQARAEFARQLRNVALQHGRPSSVQLVLQGRDDFGMIMARVVHAISREEVQDGPSVAGLQLY